MLTTSHYAIFLGFPTILGQTLILWLADSTQPTQNYALWEFCLDAVLDQWAGT